MTTETTAPKTYRIAAPRMGTLETYVEKLNKQARKLSCPEISIVTVEIINETNEETGSVKQYHVISIDGAAPRIAGWSFISKIDHLGAEGNIVRAIPNADIPEIYRTIAGNCDHCQINRNRKITYILRNEAGEYKQVGSSCLVDFLGARDPNGIASLCEAMGDFVSKVEAMEDEEYGQGGWSNLFDVEIFLAYVALVIRTEGWTSRKTAEERQTASTCDRALYIMDRKKSSRRPEDNKTPEGMDRETAQAAIEWAKNIEPTNDYEHNLKVLVSSEVVKSRYLGIVASVIAAWKRTTAQAAERKAQAAVSNYFGTVGKRETFTLTVIFVREIPGYRDGVTNMHKFQDAQGNIAIWFASNGTAYEPGQTVTLKATVKAHEEYRGIKQTTITRCAEVK